MGLFEKFKKLFSKSVDLDESLDNNDPFENQQYLEKYQNNNQNITEEVMDILLLEEKQGEEKNSELVISEYDAGDVDLLELENQKVF